MSTKMVTVACKLPHGLTIEVGTVGAENYQRVELNGPYTSNRTGQVNSLLVGGYCFTQVPEDIWSEFVRKHAGAKYLKTRAVFSENTLEQAQAAALSEKNTPTGFERLNPDNPGKGIEPDKDHLRTLQRISP